MYTQIRHRSPTTWCCRDAIPPESRRAFSESPSALRRSRSWPAPTHASTRSRRANGPRALPPLLRCTRLQQKNSRAQRRSSVRYFALDVTLPEGAALSRPTASTLGTKPCRLSHNRRMTLFGREPSRRSVQRTRKRAADGGFDELSELPDATRARREILCELWSPRPGRDAGRLVFRADSGERQPEGAASPRRHDDQDRGRTRSRRRRRTRFAADRLFRAPHPAVEAAERHARLHGSQECCETHVLRLANFHLDGEGPGQHRILT